MAGTRPGRAGSRGDRAAPVSRRARLAIGAVLTAATVLLGLGLGGAASATVTTLESVADSYMNAGLPQQTNGGSPSIRINDDPERRAYLRFHVQGLHGPVLRATLQLFTTSGSTTGFDVRSVADNGWDESTLTYGNAPPASSSITGASGPFTANRWVSVDVTALVTGEGPVSLALTSSRGTGISLASREAGMATAPRLVVETADAPRDMSRPAVAGMAREGAILTADPGAWGGTEPIALGFQWQRCDPEGAQCVDVAGAVARDYQLVPADIGAAMRVLVTARNVAGEHVAASPATAPVEGRPPANGSLPSLTGILQEGATLTALPGQWTGTEPIEYGYQWQRCDPESGACTDIPGATGKTLLLTPSDIGFSARVMVTARSVAGEGAASSPAGPPIEGRPPRVHAPPAITGDAVESNRLTIEVGTWSGTVTTVHTYAWQRCDATGGACEDVAGATGKTFLLTTADIGATLRAIVTGSNVAGQLAIATPPTPVVAGRPPLATSPPTVSGSAIEASRLTAYRGAWRGTATVTFAYRWRRCDAGGQACTDISGATGQTYVPIPADVGTTLRVAIVATNAIGERTETSEPTAPVLGRPPVNSAPPTVMGTAAEGQRLTAGNGSWRGTPLITLAYRWQRCDAAGDTCADVAGATAKTYVLTADDVAATMRVVVTASNVAGDTPAPSAPSPAVEGRPPSPPRKVTAVGSGGTVTLDWVNNPESDVVGYRVYRRKADEPWLEWPIATTAVSRFVDQPPADNDTFSYRVTAVDKTALASDWSAIVSALPTGAVPRAAAAGDIACDPASLNFRGGLGTAASCRQHYTAAQIEAVDAILALGDLQYEDATLDKFALSYDLSWGRVRAHTHPAVGNHEYITAGAAGYFDYFNGPGVEHGPAGDRGKGYYSYNLGSWHLVALNSNCSKVGGCGAGSPQERWLRADLAANANRCALAYWHHPRFSGGKYTDNPAYVAFWQALHEAGAELVLSGHDHNYQRYAPRDAHGAADATGPRQFVVGTGGKSQYPVAADVPDREAANGNTSGVLKLDLRPDGYDWNFEPEAGKTFTDSGSADCR